MSKAERARRASILQGVGWELGENIQDGITRVWPIGQHSRAARGWLGLSLSTSVSTSPSGGVAGLLCTAAQGPKRGKAEAASLLRTYPAQRHFHGILLVKTNYRPVYMKDGEDAPPPDGRNSKECVAFRSGSLLNRRTAALSLVSLLQYSTPYCQFPHKTARGIADIQD